MNLELDAYQYLSLCVKRNCLSTPRLPGALGSNLCCDPTGTVLGGNVCLAGLEEACPLAALPPDAPSGNVSLPTAGQKPEPEACLGDFLLPVLVILVDRAGIGVSFFNFLLRNIEKNFSLHLIFVLLNTKRQRTWSQDSVRSHGRDVGLGRGRGARRGGREAERGTRGSAGDAGLGRGCGAWRGMRGWAGDAGLGGGRSLRLPSPVALSKEPSTWSGKCRIRSRPVRCNKARS